MKTKEWEEIVNGKRIRKLPAYKRHGNLNAEIVSSLSEVKANYKILSGLDCEIELVIEIEEGRLKKRYIKRQIWNLI